MCMCDSVFCLSVCLMRCICSCRAPRPFGSTPGTYVQFKDKIIAKSYTIQRYVRVAKHKASGTDGNLLKVRLGLENTRKYDLLDLNADYEDEVKLEKINSVDFSVDEVDVHLKVEKFTEASQTIILNVTNVPDSVIIRTFPKEIVVTYFVALSDYDKVVPQLFEAIVDYNEIASQKEKLSIKIINSPDYIQSLRYNPKSVEYIIEKKE